jgi:cytidylate kinase
MSVVTISRQHGSEGSAIGRQVAQTLNYHYVDKKIIEEVLVQYGYVEFRKEYESVPGFWAPFDARRTEMMGMLDRVIRALAHHNNAVIVGRGSFTVLGGFADVLNVRIQAPFSVRYKRVQAREDAAPQHVEESLKENDRVRANFIESFYSVRWDSASAFDLVIDTSKVPPELAVNWLVDAVKSLNENNVPRTTRMLQVDQTLAQTVTEVLARQMVH